MNNFKTFGPSELLLFLAVITYALLSANPLLTLCAGVVPFILMKLLWKENEAPLLFLAFLMQWLAITAKVFYANYNGEQFNDVDLHRYPEQIQRAFFLALLGLLGMALGVHLIIRRLKLKSTVPLLEFASHFEGSKIVKLYLIFLFAYPFLFKMAFMLGGLQQPIIKLLEYKWSLFFVFMLFAFQRKEYKLFITIFLIEFVLSLTGFFSVFKDYFLVTGIAFAIILKGKFKPVHIFPAAALMFFVVYSLLAWSYVKPAYRSFLNAGSKQQVSVRSNSEALSKLFELTSSIDSTAIKEGFEATVNRVSYIDFLSGTLANVPSQVAHTNGTLWLGAIEKVLKPRIFFPEKEIIDDSEKARLYTGGTYAGAEQGTSISLGYYAESYVDFGETGMVMILFVFGLLVGLIYKYVMENSPNRLIGTALLIPFFFTIYSYEKALDKIFVALLLYFVIYLFIKAFVLKGVLNYLKGN